MISQEIVIDGKRYKIALEGQFKVTPIDAPPVPNPDPEPGKPTEGTIKEGGWGAGTDATKWKGNVIVPVLEIDDITGVVNVLFVIV